MGASGLLSLAFLAGAARAADDAWTEVWARAAALREAPEASPERAALAGELRSLLERRGTGFRARVLEALLQRAAGRPATVDPATLTSDELPLPPPSDWEPGLPRAAAEVLEPGPERAAFARTWVERASPAENDAALDLGYRVLLEEQAGYRTEGALALARALHERAGATWSATNLALMLSRLGRTDEALELLAAQLERVAAERRDPAEALQLVETRGWIALGAGRRAAGLDLLGRAWSKGSESAGIILARLALDEGRTAAARVVFRSLLAAELAGTRAWARRGWGLALLREHVRSPSEAPSPDREP